ncbi:MarR family transcriptional regulator [Actinomadura sp. 3N407]|uniref:MarR family transcriptional regulator n=1 Tax=Actinomadura sp. 3N407 TaxID=3457423 RepID=UPI003FCDD91C
MAKTNIAAPRRAGTETAPDGPTAADNTAPAASAGTGLDGAAAAVWDALAGNPGATVTAIAAAADMPKGTARKALQALESQDLVVRTPGGRNGGKRAPDTWRPAEPDADQDTTPHGTSTPDGGTPDGATPDRGVAATEDQTADAPSAEGAAASEDTAPADTDTADAPADAEAEAEATDAEEEGMDAAAVTEASGALTELRDAVGAALTALESGDRAAALAVAETIYTGSGKARRLVRAAANGRPRTASGRARSHPGELRGKVAAHLAAHPGAEFTPHEIGKVVGHSAGAIANALDRLVALGEAVTTCERPRRFSAAPDTPVPVAPAAGEGANAEAPSEAATA